MVSSGLYANVAINIIWLLMETFWWFPEKIQIVADDT